MKRFIRGSLVQAQAGAIAEEELVNIRAAEKSRANRQARSRRAVQKGGVIYAHQARAVVSKKDELDTRKQVERAERELERLKKATLLERKKIWKPIFQELKRSRPKIKPCSPKNIRGG